MVKDEPPLIQLVISGDCPTISMVTEPVKFSNRESRENLPDDYVYWGLLHPPDSCDLSRDSLGEALRSDPAELALKITSHWDSSIRSLLELQEKSFTSGLHVYSASPELGTWEPSAYISVLRDALHLMSPSGGLGAVAALNDAAALAQIIANEQGVLSVPSGLKFERAMRNFARLVFTRISQQDRRR